VLLATLDKAEALYLAARNYEALEAIKEGELIAKRFESWGFDAPGVIVSHYGLDSVILLPRQGVDALCKLQPSSVFVLLAACKFRHEKR
jgi:hypothetical protein